MNQISHNDLTEYLKESGWSGSHTEFTRKSSIYFETIKTGDMGDYVWSKHFLNTNPVELAFFSYTENLIEFLKEKAND
jgi:hypothetical protein